MMRPLLLLGAGLCVMWLICGRSITAGCCLYVRVDGNGTLMYVLM
jgi:hypothetical protein